MYRHPSALFLDRDDRRRWEDFLTNALAAADERMAQGSVTPTLDLSTFRRELAGFDFATPGHIKELLAWTIAQMECGIVHVTHPRYFGLFNPAPTTPAQWADRIAASFNPQLATWTTSPAAVEIEAHVIAAVIRRAGLSADAAGHFTTGGAEANYTALLCALTHVNPAFATDGARAFAGRPVFYTSRESHLAWIKIAHQVGIGRSGVRLVATDGTGRMDLDALADAIAADRERGCIPVMIVATAGTTNAGMIDPLPQCAQLARLAGAWFHVDAAWGGGLIASTRLHHHLSGIELADSVTIDAHKWFATTMGCGMFVTRHRPILSATFQVSTSYMPSNARDLDPYVTSIQWSRRFLGLRLFLSLAVAGWAGHADHVERAVELADLLKTQLADQGWRTVNQSSLAVLCLEPPEGSGDVRSIVGAIVASGLAWVSVATFEGRDIIRACITHGETTSQDIAALVEALTSARARRSAEGHPQADPAATARS